MEVGEKVQNCSSTSFHFQIYCILVCPFCPRMHVIRLTWFHQIPNRHVKCRCHRCLRKETIKSQWFEHNLQRVTRFPCFSSFCFLNEDPKYKDTTHQFDSPHHHICLLPYQDKSIWNFYPSMITATCYIYYSCNCLCSWIEWNWCHRRAKIITYIGRRSDVDT